MVSLSVVVCFAVLSAAAAASNVLRQCPGKEFPTLNEAVQLSPCQKAPCKLKRGTQQHITINFTPTTDLDSVTNHVSAVVLGVPLPFIGVDGTPICDKVFTESGEKAGCPLKAGTKYVYKDSFPILEFYPTIQTIVNWQLGEDSENIVCFQVPVKIVN